MTASGAGAYWSNRKILWPAMSILPLSNVVSMPEQKRQSNPEKANMRYMLLIYSNERAETQADPAESMKIMQAHQAVMEGTQKAGIFRAADPLHPTSTATTIRHENGQPITIDGPFAETKEQLGGYYILDCKDLDEAIYWASKIPTACKGGSGCVEIRPIMELGELEKMVKEAAGQAAV
ncbi:MAG TPA: YciI family protein [Terriglobales bacterium]|nr:YciI family protein [Terriglobales bacterium]